MLWSIDRTDPTPLHEQLAAEVRRAIGEGALAAGHRLPPARDLALAVEVNANTVLRAYRTLRDEGLVEFRRGRGVRVVESAGARAPVTAAALALLHLGRRHGYSHAELLELLTSLQREQPA